MIQRMGPMSKVMTPRRPQTMGVNAGGWLRQGLHYVLPAKKRPALEIWVGRLYIKVYGCTSIGTVKLTTC